MSDTAQANEISSDEDSFPNLESLCKTKGCEMVALMRDLLEIALPLTDALHHAEVSDVIEATRH